MKYLTVTIPGLPHGQGRPRAFVRGKHAGVYDPPASRSWKAFAGEVYGYAISAQGGCVTLPAFSGPVSVSILAVWPCPKSARKADRLIQRPRVGKPDADNVAKAVCDAGNGVLWADDAQVSELHVVRIVGHEGEAPRVEVTVVEAPLMRE